ncbi:MAG: hypothetical protein FLDDKLPJ_01692 [Phycisphaerae bacterium]|nr:hypothetical protein [Phycisphaerae bacterium]
MPTYDYECTRCGEKFELFQSIKDRVKKTLAVDCAECKNRAPVVRCIGTGGGLIFKGSGFYITDYRSEGYKEAAKAESDSGKAKSDAKPDGKSDAPASKAASGAKSESGDAGGAASPSGSSKPKAPRKSGKKPQT